MTKMLKAVAFTFCITCSPVYAYENSGIYLDIWEGTISLPSNFAIANTRKANFNGIRLYSLGGRVGSILIGMYSDYLKDRKYSKSKVDVSRQLRRCGIIAEEQIHLFNDKKLRHFLIRDNKEYLYITYDDAAFFEKIIDEYCKSLGK